MRGTGKKKIEIKRIEKEPTRMVTFSKRRNGLIKKAVELEDKTGARVALVVFSPRDNPFIYGDIPAMSQLVENEINNNNCDISTMINNNDNSNINDNDGASPSDSSSGSKYDSLKQSLTEFVDQCDGSDGNFLEAKKALVSLIDEINNV